MRLHQTIKYKTWVILIYQIDGYYQAFICSNKNTCSKLLALHTTSYEATTYAKKRIDAS